MCPQAPTPPIPIVLIGLHTEMARPISEGLKPDYEILRFIQTQEAAKQDLPHLLQGETPPNPPTNDIGTEHHDRPARAVLLGRGFTTEQAEALYGLFKDAGPEPVLWVARAGANPRPAGGLAGMEGVIISVFRSVLDEWRDQGADRGRLVLY
ncbi:hypothetical protein F4861DRAFT_491866 [Xylaria intraflava]|nr:hypothetical protein F4861DRAFT_491866 [Xylaria intraflava]